MAKKKFELTNDLIVSNTELQSEKSSVKDPEQTVAVTIMVPKQMRHEMKIWCASNNTTISNALREGFKLYRDQFESLK